MYRYAIKNDKNVKPWCHFLLYTLEYDYINCCIFSLEVSFDHTKGERDDSFGMIKGDLQGDRRVLFTIN